MEVERSSLLRPPAHARAFHLTITFLQIFFTYKSMLTLTIILQSFLPKVSSEEKPQDKDLNLAWFSFCVVLCYLLHVQR